MTAQFIKLLEVFGIRKKLRKITDTATNFNIAGNTAVTGTLSATDIATLSGGTVHSLMVGGAAVGSIARGLALQNTTSLLRIGLAGGGSDYLSPTVAGDVALVNASGYKVFVGVGATAIGTFSSTGLAVTGTLSASGVTSVTDATDATSTTAASLKTAGGLAVVKKGYFGDNIVMASGKGIDFSATSNGSGTTTSEVLSDYEEGTWTPTIGSGSGTITTVTATGSYVKVGRMVHATVNISITNAGTGAGALTFTVPFTSNVAGNSAAGSGVETAAVGFTGTCYLGTNSVTVSAYKDGFTTPIGTGNGLIYSIIYQTA